MKLTAKGPLVCVLLLYLTLPLQSQTKRVIVNTTEGVYELTGAGGTCTYVAIPDVCPGAGEGYFSSALYNQTLYFISLHANNVYSVELGVPGSCRFVGRFPSLGPNATGTSVNAFTVDKNGMLYGVGDGNMLYRLNPYTKETTTLGKLPVSPGGDLVFYGDKLILATTGKGLYEINMDDPASSTQYMSTGNYTFWGLISFPFDCVRNKVYGFAPGRGGTDLVELDLEARTVGAVACSLPLLIFDAASVVETGNTLGIWVDSILIEAPCTAEELTGNVSILAYSATPGAIRYKLNNGMENTTGKFQQLNRGTYQVNITNPIGCVTDTSFTIMQGLSPHMTATSTDPAMCELPNGAIFIEAFSNYPVSLRVNDGPPQFNLRLTGLGAGVYNLLLSDQGNCQSDTQIVLRYLQRPDFLGAITTQPTFCEARSGSINVQINGNDAGITASLNGGAYKPLSELKDLQSGNYRLAILNTSNCHYDTLLQIGKLIDPPPTVNFEITDQFCFDNNGKVVINATGVGSPFDYNISSGNYTPSNSFGQLAPGSYKIGVRNSNYCYWDSVAEVKPYLIAPYNVAINKKDPTCRAIKSGELRINISGNEAPYYFSVNDKVYPSGELVLLPPGNYPVSILNNGQCVIESASVDMVLHYEPECDRVSMPNAFSPNNDGNNDFFKPIHTPYVTQVSMTIYNRYGQVVFRSSPGQAAWDGRLNGKQVDTGNYVWTLTWIDFSGKPKKTNGLVLVIR